MCCAISRLWMWGAVVGLRGGREMSCGGMSVVLRRRGVAAWKVSRQMVWGAIIRAIAASIVGPQKICGAISLMLRIRAVAVWSASPKVSDQGGIVAV